MMKEKKLILVGDSAFAEIAYEYFTYDSPYEVVAFSVEREYLDKSELFGLPVVAFEEVEKRFSSTDHEIFVAITYTGLNRVRSRLMEDSKRKGFGLASYISSQAFLWRNVTLGEHCFIFEDNTIQPFVEIGSNVIMWSGNHIGHHSVIGDNCFISSHVVLSGFTNTGDNCFLGVNSTISNNVKIGRDCWLGLGVTLYRDAPAGSFFKPGIFAPTKRSTWDYFGVEQPLKDDS